MSASNKVKNSAQQVQGKVKKAVGKTEGNLRLTAEGRADQAKGSLKQAGEKVKDAF